MRPVRLFLAVGVALPAVTLVTALSLAGPASATIRGFPVGNSPPCLSR